MAEHANLVDPDVHEPRGASTATVGQAYLSDGAGSGDWADVVQGIPAVAYADKVLVGDGITPKDFIIPAAVDPLLRTYDDFVRFTNAFDPDIASGLSFDGNGDFVVATTGIYQFNVWFSEEITTSKAEFGITFYKNQGDPFNLTGPIGGPVVRNKTKDLGAGEAEISTIPLSGIISLSAGDVVGISIASTQAGTISIFDGSMSFILLEEL